jgi:hypothetical protein
MVFLLLLLLCKKDTAPHEHVLRFVIVVHERLPKVAPSPGATRWSSSTRTLSGGSSWFAQWRIRSGRNVALKIFAPGPQLDAPAELTKTEGKQYRCAKKFSINIELRNEPYYNVDAARGVGVCGIPGSM